MVQGYFFRSLLGQISFSLEAFASLSGLYVGGYPHECHHAVVKDHQVLVNKVFKVDLRRDLVATKLDPMGNYGQLWPQFQRRGYNSVIVDFEMFASESELVVLLTRNIPDFYFAAFAEASTDYEISPTLALKFTWEIPNN